MSTPRVQFLIGGVQKGGTTALAQFVAQHPQVVLPRGKEAHVFDAPDFDPHATVETVDASYAAHFMDEALPTSGASRLYGDATPIYCFHPTLIQRIARYNPAMRWIVLLRHPVERAVSHYQMERGRGDEHWPMLPAMVLERWRLRGHAEDFSHGSPLRHFSYRARGDYARQLATLYAHFPAQQVLVLRNDALAQQPEAVMAQVWAFLQLPALPAEQMRFARVFAGGYAPLPHNSAMFRLLAWLMARPIRQARQRYGLDWSSAATTHQDEQVTR